LSLETFSRERTTFRCPILTWTKKALDTFHGRTALTILDILIVEVSTSHSRHITLSTNPLDELWPPSQRQLPANAQHSHMLQTGFEHVMPACDQLQTHALERTASRIGKILKIWPIFGKYKYYMRACVEHKWLRIGRQLALLDKRHRNCGY